MKLSMYQAGPARLIISLGDLLAILDKAAAYAAEKNIDPAVLLNARLYPDMFPFSRQVQQACSTVEAAVARMAVREIPVHENTEKTFEELKARLAKAISFLQAVPEQQLDGTDEKEFLLKLPRGEMRWTGMQYLFGFAVPNFYFHMTTAYDILRHNGVPLGKRDFIPNP